jgi:hypothetical protein
MKNFAKKSFIEKKTWGVLGKIQELYSPEQFQDETRIVPLNANPLEAWDSTRSRYRRRVQGPLPNDGQQAGVVPQVSDVTPTPTPSNPATSTPTPTPSFTPTVTPSSTPYPLPETPSLWYDSTNVGSIDYITSGGTDYVATWRSIGTYQKTLTGSTTNNMPIWSGSSRFPDSPRIVRFTRQSNTALIQWLSQRFDSTPIPQSGITIFQVVANPVGGTYSVGGASSFLFPLQLVSGNTTTGGFTTPLQLNYNNQIDNPANGFQVNTTINGVATANSIPQVLSGNAINSKFLYSQVVAQASGSSPFTLNATGGTLSTPITGTNQGNITTVILGTLITSGGTIQTTFNPHAEVGEVMVYNRVLTSGETTQVLNYLKDKWKYTSW